MLLVSPACELEGQPAGDFMNLNRRPNFPNFRNRGSISWVFLGHQIFEGQGMGNIVKRPGVIILLVE